METQVRTSQRCVIENKVPLPCSDHACKGVINRYKPVFLIIETGASIDFYPCTKCNRVHWPSGRPLKRTRRKFGYLSSISSTIIYKEGFQ